ncbi:GNAT family N-acetyltransferase [Bacillus tuaregi]|uniref:GNAT family N-acetyltransferase n=1 Tax=Bacillus tuaregi TaxID=1816695 RepID=UPI0008F85315|nr:GNAT family N-acetyltransferase [Bacillus tuaregi]
MKSQLQAGRIKLVQTERKHAPALFLFWSDPDVTRYMNIETFTNVDEAITMIDLLNKLAAKKQANRYTIMTGQNDTIVGSCGFNYFDYDNEKAEIGYDLGKEYWGKGFASEAVTILLQYGFQELNLNRIEAKVAPENARSKKLLEKLGFYYEGLLRESEKTKEGFIDAMLYSILQKDFQSKIFK